MQRLISNIRLVRKLVFRYTLVWVADSVSIGLTALLMPGVYFLRDSSSWYLMPFIVALLFGLLNTLVRPLLLVLLLPITFVTLGLATLLLNSALFYLLHIIVESFVIESFGRFLKPLTRAKNGAQPHDQKDRDCRENQKGKK